MKKVGIRKQLSASELLNKIVSVYCFSHSLGKVSSSLVDATIYIKRNTTEQIIRQAKYVELHFT